MYFNYKKINILDEGALFWLKNVFNHYTRGESGNISFEKAYDKLMRSIKEFNNAHFDEKLIFKKAHRAIDEYVGKVVFNMRELNMKDGPFPVDCKKLQKKLKIKEYFDSDYPEISRMIKNEDDLYGLVYYAVFSDQLFKSSFGATMAIPIVIYGNGEANIIFVTFDEDAIYKLFTVTAYNSGLDGAYKSNLTELISVFNSY